MPERGPALLAMQRASERPVGAIEAPYERVDEHPQHLPSERAVLVEEPPKRVARQVDTNDLPIGAEARSLRG